MRPFRFNAEEVACNLCGRRDALPVFGQDAHGCALSTVICRGCGLLYLNPRPGAADYRRFYEQFYHRMYPSRQAMDSQPTGQAVALATARIRVEYYRRWLAENYRLLEVGCGDGSFLRALAECPAAGRSWGLDPSPAEVLASRTKGLNVSQGYLEQAMEVPGGGGRFSAVAVFHVLEHVLDPVAFLRNVALSLDENGLLFLEVPNMLGAWSGLGMIHIAHCYGYTPASLDALLRAGGFAPVQLEALEAPLFQASIRVVARRAPPQAWTGGVGAEAIDQVRGHIQMRLQHWRRQLWMAQLKREVWRAAGTRLGGWVWERTAARSWRRELANMSVQFLKTEEVQ